MPRNRKSRSRREPAAPQPAGGNGSVSISRRGWALSAVLAVFTLALYSPVLKHPFVDYDDQHYVVENARVQQGITLENLEWAATTLDVANWHPLTWVSHELDCEWFGLNPSGHHFTSLLLHTLNAWLVFLLLARVTGREWPSFLVAALFALHPINVESVAWVSERKTVLSMFFFLLTLGAYGWYARRPAPGRYAAVAALFVLGLATKPMVVTLPCVLLLLDFWPLQRSARWTPVSQAFPLPQFSDRHLILEKLPLLALSVASSVITIVAQRPAMKTDTAIPLAARLANAIYSYVKYLWNAVWPVHLGVFYSPRGGRLAGWEIAALLAVLAGISVAVWRARSRRYLPVGWLWFLGTLVPMIGIVQAGEQGMADRYAYLPLLGVFVMVVWGGAELAAGGAFALRVGSGLAGVVLIGLSLLTWRQIQTWESSFALWSHSLQVDGNNYVAENFVGATILEERFKATGKSCADEADVHFQNAVRINPQYSPGLLNAGYCLQAHGRLVEAIKQYKMALQYAPNSYLRSRALINLGASYEERGDFAQSREHYEQALKIYPHDAEILNDLAKLSIDERIAGLSSSAQMHPTAEIFVELAQYQQQAGHSVEARESYERALRLDPRLAEAQAGLRSLDSQTMNGPRP